ncbi:hypothetical protein PF005_g12595 [Phytophthora fragariae]|uniref:Uncharacterized protein n=1 Tax=Phytophthora fragariae TaxID=53985 RepID=A0A6A3XSC7_9STRA|nr:hypothetical protein PF005_g12595 [Phytophthora fragariae]
MSQGWGFTLLPPFRLQLRAGNGPPDPSREVPLLGTGATAGAATSGSGRTVLPSVRPLGSSPLGPSLAPWPAGRAGPRCRRRSDPPKPPRAPAATPTAPQHPNDPAAGTDAEEGRAAGACSHPVPAIDVGRPGRAVGMLPVPVVPGAAQAADTARALAAAYGLDSHAAVTSDDADAQYDRAALPAADKTHVESPPGRTADRLSAGGAPMPPPTRTGPAVVPPEPSAATSPRQVPAAPLTPAHENFRHGRAGGRLADMPTPGAAPAATAAAIAEAAVAADAAAQAVDQAREPARGEDQEMKTEGSDADAAKAAAAQAAPGPNAQHLRPQDGPQDPVQATYAHDAAQFECALCAYVATDLATLVAHRRAAPRGTRLTDTFSSGCRCPLLFYARVAAASHARASAQRQPPAAAVITTTARASETKRLQPAAAVPSKRRRLSAADDADMDAEPQMATAPPTPHDLRPAIQSAPPPDTTPPAPTAAAPTATAPPPTTRATLWGPLPSATVPAQAKTGEQATDPAVRRPLAPAAPATGATRWGLRHRAIGVAAIARLVTGLPTTPAPPTRRRSAPHPTGLASGGRHATPRTSEAATVAASTTTSATMDVDGGPADPEL